MVTYMNVLWKLMVILIFSILLIPEQGVYAEKQRIFDQAGILSNQEIIDLEKQSAIHSEKRETDFIILTFDNPDVDIIKYVSDFYEEQGLGYQKKHGNTAIIALNMAKTKRDVVLLGFGKAETYLDHDKLNTIQHKVTPFLTDGNYEAAFNEFITLSAKYITFKPGTNPTSPFFNIWVQIGLSLAGAIVIVWLLARNPGMKVTTNAATYQDNQQTKVNKKRDRYMRTTVTKKRKPKPQNNSGGGTGGFRGGTTSGGRSFSGSRGKF